MKEKLFRLKETPHGFEVEYMHIFMIYIFDIMIPLSSWKNPTFIKNKTNLFESKELALEVIETMKEEKITKYPIYHEL